WRVYMSGASMHIRRGYALFIPSAIRKAVGLPVVGVGRFKDPLQAERALAEGHCDLIGVVRGQIADADFAAKARSGHADDIRLCLSCNQECVGRMGLNRWLGCVENPRTGRESVALVPPPRSEEHTSELQSLTNLVCRLLLENKKKKNQKTMDEITKHKRTTAKRQHTPTHTTPVAMRQSARHDRRLSTHASPHAAP